jgi:predicted MFS family arabinose efflux permease/quinol monooxygenase YgiN
MAADGPRTAASRGAPPASAWAPLRESPVFRALWIAQFASNVGTWMQTVGAQWLLIDRSPVLVSLVQTASSLPIVLLALPAGAWADIVDRRRLLLYAQLGMLAAAGTLTAATFAGAASPAVVLTLTFLLGCATAVAGPAWQAIQPDLVDRAALPQAAALNGVNMNLARAIGPALGGLIVAAAGPAWVFALNTLSFVGIAAVLAAWRPAPADRGDPEHLVEALRAGGRYVRHSPVVRRMLYRALLFIPAASALWALLPVVAARNLRLGSAGYGLLLAAVGAGAVGGAGLMPRLRSRLGTAALVTWAMLAAAAGIAVVATSGSAVLLALALVPVGAAWIAVLSSLNAGLQLALPGWVRARALAHYLLVFQGAQGAGAVVWGVLADRTSVEVALLVAAAAMALGAVAGLRMPIPDTARLDRTPSAHWPAPNLLLSPAAADGPVLVTVTYHVPPENAAAFATAMQPVARSRRRTGALRWELFRDGGDPTRFVESYLVGTWAEHLRQHERRQTGADRVFEEKARGYAAGEPEVAHLFPPSAP